MREARAAQAAARFYRLFDERLALDALDDVERAVATGACDQHDEFIIACAHWDVGQHRERRVVRRRRGRSASGALTRATRGALRSDDGLDAAFEPIDEVGKPAFADRMATRACCSTPAYSASRVLS